MKKETLIAIILGIGFGVVVAVFLVIKSRQLQIQSSKPITTTLSITPTPLIKNINLEILDITEPKSGDILNSNSVKIQGKTAKDTLIIIQSPLKTVVLKNTDDNFSVDFPLSMGENMLHITAYPKDGQISTKEKDLQVYYLDEQ